MNIDDHLGRVPVQAPASDSRYDKWVRWATVITDEIHGIVGSRQYMARSEPNGGRPPSSTTVAVLRFPVRCSELPGDCGRIREPDEGPDDISLWKLMTEIRDHPETALVSGTSPSTTGACST